MFRPKTVVYPQKINLLFLNFFTILILFFIIFIQLILNLDKNCMKSP